MERMKYPMAYIGQVLRMMKALLVAYVMTGFFLLITAGLMYRFELSEGKVKIAVIGIYVLSCFTGGFLAGRMMKNRKFLWGSLLGFCSDAAGIGGSQSGVWRCRDRSNDNFRNLYRVRHGRRHVRVDTVGLSFLTAKHCLTHLGAMCYTHTSYVV